MRLGFYISSALAYAQLVIIGLVMIYTISTCRNNQRNKIKIYIKLYHKAIKQTRWLFERGVGCSRNH